MSHESILLTHERRTPRAFVLYHGLTASPRQFETFAHTLFERGSNVYVPRLPRHGLADRLTTELGGLTSEELVAFARESVATALTLGDRVVVVGFSVGGLIAAWIGQHLRVERATAIAPFLGVAWIPHALTLRAARLALAMPNAFWWWNPLVRERLMPEHGYPRFATHAVAEAARLGGEVLEAANDDPPAARDVQVVLNASESTVSNPAARELARRWQRHARTIVLHRLHGLPPSHDIIEPLRSPALARRVYPALVRLVDR